MRKEHEPFAGTVPPVSVTLPAVWVTLPEAQVVEAAGVAARTSPVPGVTGNVSVTLVTVMGTLFALAIVIVSVDVAPEAMVAGVNALVIVGGAAFTVRVLGVTELVMPAAVTLAELLV